MVNSPSYFLFLFNIQSARNLARMTVCQRKFYIILTALTNMMRSNGVAAQIGVSDQQAKPEHVREKLYEYPPSVKLVFKMLEGKEMMTLRDIEKETYLPYRTVRYAVKRLKEGGLVTRIFYVKDARRGLYRLAK